MSKGNRSAREMLEKWKDIKGYEGLYQVSNTGKIKALQRFHKTSNYSSIGYIAKEKIKTVFYSKQDSYGRVGLNKNGKTTRKYIHRLVAEAFIPNPYNLPEVNHKDLNKSNNCINNLEWVTNIENKRHYQRTDIAKIINKKRGEKATKKYNQRIKSLIPFVIYAYTKLNYSIEKINKCTGIGDEKISKVLKENNIPINNKPRKKKILKRDKLGRFVKGGILYE